MVTSVSAWRAPHPLVRPVEWRLSALRLPPFFGVRFWEGLSYSVEGQLGCGGIARTGSLYPLLPACGEKSRSEATRMRGPLSEPERSSLRPAERPSHPTLSPRAGRGSSAHRQEENHRHEQKGEETIAAGMAGAVSRRLCDCRAEVLRHVRLLAR